MNSAERRIKCDLCLSLIRLREGESEGGNLETAHTRWKLGGRLVV